MRKISRFWKQGLLVALVLALDLAVTLQVVGITYRPFSWMSLTDVQEESLYPVIEGTTVNEPDVSISASVQVGQPYYLQRSTNLNDGGGWVDIVGPVTAETSVLILTDTNWMSVERFYRIRGSF